MNEQIIFTKEEAIALLKAFSNIEGFLYSIKDPIDAFDMIEYPIKLLTERLIK